MTSCDCTLSEQQSIPDIEFDIGGKTYSIPRDKWFERSGNQCVIKFMHGPHKDYWILGLNFFENYYTVFDYEQMRIGFADSINKGKSAGSSFINWAVGKSESKVPYPQLMNLMMQTEEYTAETKVFAASALGGVLMFAGYFLIMKKYKHATRVKAQVDSEYFIEKVREDDALSNTSNTF